MITALINRLSTGIIPVALFSLTFGTGFPLSAAELTVQEKALVINGSYYKKLVQQKDLIADILPPPAYIIESYLTVLRLVDSAETAMADGKIDAAEMKVIDAMIDYGVKLKDGSPGVFPGYFERIEAWKKDLTGMALS